MPERLDAVLLVLYLLFNEGYSASSGEQVVRRELCAHAIHIARVLSELMPEEAEVRGLLALMLLQDSRRHARSDARGDLVLLRDQDRTLWNRAQIEEGLRLCDGAAQSRSGGAYCIQAAIAAEHARAAEAEDTNWDQIAQLYEALLAVPAHPGDRTQSCRRRLDGARRGRRAPLAWCAGRRPRWIRSVPCRACRFLSNPGRRHEAEHAYQRAIELATNDPERRFLEGRLREVQGMAIPRAT